MKNLVRHAIVGLAACVFSASALAGGYGDAGCGLGSLVFGNKKGFVQLFAATTNSTSSSQFFGITSGTSNCDGLGHAADQFISLNKISLQHDIARGQGETIVSLSDIYGCKDSSQFGKALQEHYTNVFATDDAPGIRSRISSITNLHSLNCSL